jgi:hypothetical protein
MEDQSFDGQEGDSDAVEGYLGEGSILSVQTFLMLQLKLMYI